MVYTGDLVYKRLPLIFIILVAIINGIVLCSGEEKIIELPEVKFNSKVSVERAIGLRRSVREFEEKDLTLQQIGNLLWAASGITDKHLRLRSTPSAGALYPLEVYIVKKNGLFHYEPYTHSLRCLKEEDLRRLLCEAALEQVFILEAPLSILIACDYKRTTTRYGLRGMRYVHMEAGHMAQNISLEAVSMGLGSVCIGAFTDEILRDILGTGEEVLYIIPAGYPEK